SWARMLTASPGRATRGFIRNARRGGAASAASATRDRQKRLKAEESPARYLHASSAPEKSTSPAPSAVPTTTGLAALPCSADANNSRPLVSPRGIASSDARSDAPDADRTV